MEPYPPRGVLALQTKGWGFHTVPGGMTRRRTVFLPGLLELYRYGNISDRGMGPYPPRVALALRTPGWGFHTVRGGIDPGDHRFRPRCV